MLTVLILPTLAAAASASEAPVFFPLSFKYGDYPRVSADIRYGTPEQSQAVPTIVDTGSAAYWVNGPKAIVNYGSQYHYTQGPCNVTAKPFFNWPQSSTHTRPVYPTNGYGYAYGGNGKIVSAPLVLNDTIHFGEDSEVAPFTSQQVAIANYTQIAQGVDNCTQAFSYDDSILGLSAYVKGGSVPSFRQNLLDAGQIQSSTLSMWFDAPPKHTKGIFQGTALLGAIPNRSKYSGDLVPVAPRPPKGSIGYYVGVPTFATTGSFKKPTTSGSRILKTSSKPSACLVDSGTGQDNLPISQRDFLSATGTIIHGGFPAYNGSCASMPLNVTLDFIFAGLNNKNVTVKVPLRNYARGNTDYLGDANKCGLSMELGEKGTCVLAAPWFTGAFLAFNDEKNEISIAQGGVSEGAGEGTPGLGSVTMVKKGQGLPST